MQDPVVNGRGMQIETRQESISLPSTSIEDCQFCQVHSLEFEDEAKTDSMRVGHASWSSLSEACRAGRALTKTHAILGQHVSVDFDKSIVAICTTLPSSSNKCYKQAIAQKLQIRRVYEKFGEGLT